MKKVFVLMSVLALSLPAVVAAQSTPKPRFQVVMGDDTPVPGTAHGAYLYGLGEQADETSHALVVFAADARAAAAVMAARSGKPKKTFAKLIRVELVDLVHPRSGTVTLWSFEADAVYRLVYQDVARCEVEASTTCDASRTLGGVLTEPLTPKQVASAMNPYAPKPRKPNLKSEGVLCDFGNP
jgi:hypothetical protein